MGKNFNFDYTAIFGYDEPTPARPVPTIPIIDAPNPLTAQPRSKALTRLLQRTERDAAIKAIYGQEMLDLIKNPVHPVTLPPAVNALRPPISTNTFDPPRRTQAHSDLPEAETGKDVRPRVHPPCDCDCGMCETGGCWNCLGNPRCQYARADLLDRMKPKPDADEEEDAEEIEAEFLRAARSKETAQDRFTRHRTALKTMADEFAKRVQCSGALFNLALDRTLDSMARFVVDAVATA